MDEEVGTEFRAAETTAVPAHERLRAMSVDSEPLLRMETAAEPRLRDASPVTMAEPQLHAMPVESERRLQDASPVTMAEPRLQDGEPLTATRTAADALARPRFGTVSAGTGLQPTTAALRATSGQPVEKRAAASQSGGGPASAGSGFKVSPEQYRAAIAPVLAASDQIAELSTSLSSFLSGMQAGKPWGDDESGKKFAEGEKGYLKYSEDTLKGLAGLPKGLKYIADGLKAMAENYEGTETVLSGDMTGQDSELQATQGTYWSPAAGASSAAPTAPILPNATLSGIAQSRPHITGRH